VNFVKQEVLESMYNAYETISPLRANN